MKQTCLRVCDLSVEIDKRALLQHIGFCAYSGETLAICGLRFTGKSVLARLLTGESFPYTGSIWLDDELLRPTDGVAFRDIFYISERNGVFPNMTLTDILFGIRVPNERRILYRQRAARVQTERILSSLNLTASWDATASELSNAQYHLLMIEKAKLMGAKIVILDSVSENYTSDEYVALERAINGGDGLAFLYISNREDSIVRAANRVLLIKNGQPAGLMYHDDYSSALLRRVLEGSSDGGFKPRASCAVSDVIASFSLPLRNESRFSFDVNAGEIVGVYDKMGGNAEAIVNALTCDTAACVKIGGCTPRNYSSAVKCGLSLVTHNYSHDSNVVARSFEDNLSFQSLRRISKYGYVSRSILRYMKNSIESEYSYEDNMGFLETVLLRWLLSKPKVLILENILFGLDAMTRARVARILDKAARDGVAVVIITTEYALCEQFCDRTIVL